MVALQLDALSNSKTPSQAKQILETLPRGLDGFYERTLQNIEGAWREQALAALQWLAFSVRPLQLKELAEAIVIQASETPPLKEENRLWDLTAVLEILPGLVSLASYTRAESHERSEKEHSGLSEEDTRQSEENIHHMALGNITVQLAHFSVKEYLVSKRIVTGRVPRYSISEISANTIITETCLAYLAYVCSIDDPFEHILESYPLLEYACYNWPQHLKQPGPHLSESTCRLVKEFFVTRQDAFQVWARYIDIADKHLDIFNWFTSRFWYRSKCSRLPLRPCAENDAPNFPLIYASNFDLPYLVELLAKEVDNVNLPSYNGPQLLIAAAALGYDQVVRFLLEAGADVNAEERAYKWTNLRGDTITSLTFGDALSAASCFRHQQVVDTLLRAGAEVNAKDGYSSALTKASIRGRDHIVNALLHAGANVNKYHGHRRSALTSALCTKWNESTVKILLEAGADIEAIDTQVGTPLMRAVDTGSKANMVTLLEAGANVNARVGKYGNALQLVIAQRDIEAVKLLLAWGADIFQPEKHPNAILAVIAEREEKLNDTLWIRTRPEPMVPSPMLIALLEHMIAHGIEDKWPSEVEKQNRVSPVEDTIIPSEEDNTS